MQDKYLQLFARGLVNTSSYHKWEALVLKMVDAPTFQALETHRIPICFFPERDDEDLVFTLGIHIFSSYELQDTWLQQANSMDHGNNVRM